MTRASTGLCLAAAFGLAVTLGAQTTTTTSQTRPTMDHDHDNIAVTGCLQRDASGGFVLANAHIDKRDRSASTTTTTGTTTGTTGTTTTGTTGTTATTTTAGSEASAMTPAATWKLEGSSSELDHHVGHRVTITGREIAASSPSTSAGTTGTTATTGTTGQLTTGPHLPTCSGVPLTAAAARDSRADAMRVW